MLIKITYVAELPVEDEKIVFNLPGSLAPWSRDLALKDSTQVIFFLLLISRSSFITLVIAIAILLYRSCLVLLFINKLYRRLS